MKVSIGPRVGAWLAQCEECFLGRARTDAVATVGEAMRRQSPWPLARFEPDDVCALGLYQPPLSDIVLAVKKLRWARAGKALGRILGQRARAKFGRAIDVSPRTWIVVPVPTPFIRRVMRGIDHSDIIAGAVAAELRLPLCRTLWQRHGRTQKTLGRAGRLRRLQRFAVRSRFRSRLAGKSVLLVDDIRTTGATIAEIGRVLRKMGVVRTVAAVVCLVEK